VASPLVDNMRISVVIPNYNGAATVIRAAQAMLRQATTHPVTVVVVDDGSTDGSAESVEASLGSEIRLVALKTNQGRSTARNEGAMATDAELLIFIDSDCVPVGTEFIAEHLSAIQNGAAISFGQICTPGRGFWDRLQRHSNVLRSKQFKSGQWWAFTTQNVAVTRQAFDQVHGFDPLFNRHGFEDRDLFVRLVASGAQASYTPKAQVVHEDRISLFSVARKQGDAGYFSAHLFRQRHPQVYSQMAYSRLDCGLHPWLSIVDATLSPLAARLARGKGRWLDWEWLPFGLRAFLARAIYGLSYLHGTARRLREGTS
jgi:GT2 family glycosyltransferase